MWNDPAVALVCGYLRVNGYFALDEFEVTISEDGHYRSLTDLDVIAIRLPTARETEGYRGRRPAVRSVIAAAVDPRLDVAEDRLDVLLVEVKQGEVEFNPNIRHPATLHAALHRVGGDLGGPISQIVDSVIDRGFFVSPVAQVRLLAIGSHGSTAEGESMTHGELLTFLESYVERHEGLLRTMQLGDPMVSFLELVQKAHGALPA